MQTVIATETLYCVCAEVLQHDGTSLYSAADMACILLFAEEGLAHKTMHVQTLEAITFGRQ